MEQTIKMDYNPYYEVLRRVSACFKDPDKHLLRLTSQEWLSVATDSIDRLSPAEPRMQEMASRWVLCRRPSQCHRATEQHAPTSTSQRQPVPLLSTHRQLINTHVFVIMP
jgi:hypothetical protein